MSARRLSWVDVADLELDDAPIPNASDSDVACTKCWARPGRILGRLSPCELCGRQFCGAHLSSAPTSTLLERATRRAPSWCDCCALEMSAKEAALRVERAVVAATIASIPNGPLPAWGGAREADDSKSKALRVLKAAGKIAEWAPGVPAAARSAVVGARNARAAGYVGLGLVLLHKELVELLGAFHAGAPGVVEGPFVIADACVQLYYAAAAVRRRRIRKPLDAVFDETAPEAAEAAIPGDVAAAIFAAAPFALVYAAAATPAEAHRLARLGDGSALVAEGAGWRLFHRRDGGGRAARVVLALRAGDDAVTCGLRSTQFEDGARACGAAVASAYGVFNEAHGAVAALLAADGAPRLLVVGHGAAGAAAGLVALQLRPLAPDRVRGVAFGAPPSCEPRLAAAAAACVVHVGLGDDVAPRFSRRAAAAALRDLAAADFHADREADARAVAARALELWPPRRRTDSRVGAIRRRLSSLGAAPEEEAKAPPPPPDDGDDVDLVVAGELVHAFRCHGRWMLSAVDRSFYDGVVWSARAVSDHYRESYHDALRACARRRAMDPPAVAPPPWETARDTCKVCENRFTWESTSDSAAQRAFDTHRCKHCGALVCDACSRGREPLFHAAIFHAARICDACRVSTSF
ncbi:hypothetical protein AURANDRAFT_65985 [Aureococcus anophagefferens]|uniref:FYVE-type domain-containing protein n=1 Tax=Aureococcus anophagefferens TaxID=44056 RepID=F0YFX9_AURAN|nr:hypothetical protein AURANDRAFT_65985 [Aureococcus anophagefferens]EGB06006.1 hypothetical protein AURANDRAFT_65985 [Aureococcus anophagefferens]|eukprot:XP_009039263.1 hypothetical protein AURANDRAFT_65985 [Aureococcus anophagefferens]